MEFNFGNYEVREEQKIAIVNKLILAEAEGYKKQFIRPYTVHVDRRDLDIIREAVELKKSSGGRTVVENMVPNIYDISARPIAEAPIVGGWEEKRFKFILEIEFKVKGSRKSFINYIQGYTDHFGVSTLTGKTTLDEKNMRFIPNSIIRMVKNVDREGRPMVRIIGNYKLTYDETRTLRDFKAADLNTIIAEIKSLRDMDVVTISKSNVGDIINPNLIPAEINIPVKQIANLIEKTIEIASLEADQPDNDSYITSVLANVINNTMEDIEFLAKMIQLKGMDFWYFTLEDLKYIDPFVERKMKVILRSGIQQQMVIQKQPILDTENFAETYDSSMETRVAVFIQETLADIMAANFISHIAFTATNLTGTFEYALADVSPIVEGLNILPFVNKFMTEFRNYVWNPLTHNEEMGLKIMVDSYLDGDTILTVSVDDNVDVVYKFPTFANSKFTPIIMDERNVKNIAANINEITDLVYTETTRIEYEAIKQQMHGPIPSFNPF